MIILDQVLQQFDALLRLDVIVFDQILAHLQLEEAALLLHLLGNLARTHFGAYQARVLGLRLFLLLDLEELGLVVFGRLVEGPLHLALDAAQLGLEQRVHREHHNVADILHLQGRRRRSDKGE